MNRPSFDDIFLEFAEKIATRSYDEKLKVGCIIVSTDHSEVFSIGFNGNAHGLPNKRDSLEAGQSGFIHAELNAAIKCRALKEAPKNVYVNYLPCKMCAKSLIQLGGVERVFFRKFHEDNSAIDIFKQVGIELIQK